MEGHEIKLPMLDRYPILAGALAGIGLRLVFCGEGGSNWSAMVGAFIFGAPIVVGMLTVYLAERQQRRTWKYYIFAPMLATGLFVFGTLLVLIEGLICVFVIVPMFSLLGALGGVIMGVVCRLTRWPKQTLQSFAVLPLVLASLGDFVATPSSVGVIERTVLVRAPAAVVWQQLNDVRDIQPSEMNHALAARIGAPIAMSGVTRRTASGLVRESHWGKGVHFEELIREWQPNRYVRWTYRFAPDSVPREALDDHVVIGGHYFDLVDTSYRLTSERDATRLEIRVRYRIATQFNLYADWVAQLLLDNLGEVGLQLFKSRSERAWAGAPTRPGQESR